MLARPQRLTDSRSFSRVRQQGRACNHALLVVVSRPTGAPETRVGFAVGKRVGHAVMRNTIKRRLREATRAILPRIVPGHDVLVIARPALATVSFEELSTALEMTLRRARLLQAVRREAVALPQQEVPALGET